MRPRVTIVDYGMGNLFSVSHAFEYCGAMATISSRPAEVLDAEYLVLPGVGAFADGMKGLHERGLIGPIRQYVTRGGAFLGICLGMQMMLEESEEFGKHEGLGLIPGRVVPIPSSGIDGTPHRIPHVGWNRLVPAEGRAGWGGTILNGFRLGGSVYFVHSFTATPTHRADKLADCIYGGHAISAVIGSGSLYGCQFHPEKSGEVGLRIIKNFIGTNLAEDLNMAV